MTLCARAVWSDSEAEQEEGYSYDSTTRGWVCDDTVQLMRTYLALVEAATAVMDHFALTVSSSGTVVHIALSESLCYDFKTPFSNLYDSLKKPPIIKPSRGANFGGGTVREPSKSVKMTRMLSFFCCWSYPVNLNDQEYDRREESGAHHVQLADFGSSCAPQRGPKSRNKLMNEWLSGSGCDHVYA